MDDPLDSSLAAFVNNPLKASIRTRAEATLPSASLMVTTCRSSEFKSTRKTHTFGHGGSLSFSLRRLHHQSGHAAISSSVSNTQTHSKLYDITISLFQLTCRRLRQDLTEPAGHNCILARFQHPNAHDDLIGIVGNAGTRLGRTGGRI
jgi:hypothetical protein